MNTPKCPRLTKYVEIAYIMIIYEKIVEGYLKHLIQDKQFKCNAPEILTHRNVMK